MCARALMTHSFVRSFIPSTGHCRLRSYVTADGLLFSNSSEALPPPPSSQCCSVLIDDGNSSSSPAFPTADIDFSQWVDVLSPYTSGGSDAQTIIVPSSPSAQSLLLLQDLEELSQSVPMSVASGESCTTL